VPLETVKIVLVETSHPGNIGATARAMKNMGLCRLSLVRPNQFPSSEATARASGADDVLYRAEICADLPQAIAGIPLVIGASARDRSIPWPVLTPAECARKIVANSGQAAIVFGREHSGLTNEELDLCGYLLRIPTNPHFASLNVAAAVQLAAYELRLAALAGIPTQPVRTADPPALAQELAHFYAHLEQTLVELDFLNPQKPKKLMRRLHRLFNRVELRASEVAILRGMLTAAQRAAEQKIRADE